MLESSLFIVVFFASLMWLFSNMNQVKMDSNSRTYKKQSGTKKTSLEKLLKKDEDISEKVGSEKS